MKRMRLRYFIILRAQELYLYKIKNSGNQPEFNHQSKNEQLLNCWYRYISVIGIMHI